MTDVCSASARSVAAAHASGYPTLGDDIENWGYVSAVEMSTESAFDANPDIEGLPRCQ